MSYSTQKVSNEFLSELKKMLHKVSYGSIEIIVQDSTVTQITVRNIKKTSYKLKGDERENVNSNVKKIINIPQRPRYISTIAASKIRVLTIEKD